jgi:SAM-dependent methyltransferase
MFVIREPPLPTVQNTELLKKYADELIAQSRDPEDVRSYYEGHRNRLSFDLDYADKFFRPGQKILEVGSIPYLVTVPLMQKNYDVMTLDKVTGEYVPGIVKKYKINSIICNLDNEPILAGDGAFDGIIMNEVFEHLRMNLIFSMREILRVLRPGGLLLLSTPNMRSISGLYNLLVLGEAYACMGGIYNNYSYIERLDVMGHVREYTPKEVTNFLRIIGFEIEGIIYRGGYSGSWKLNLARFFTRIWPQFKPYFSVVARKPLTAPAA